MQKKRILNIIAANVKQLMNEQNESITTLARRCKVSAGTISKIISASMSITIPMAMTIADGLQVDLAEIIKGLNITDFKSLQPTNLKKSDSKLSIGILSINNRRITCIKDNQNNTIGFSELEGSLDLLRTTSELMPLIEQSIQLALPPGFLEYEMKETKLNIVAQSYEFEKNRENLANYLKKQFHSASILPDWQFIYFSVFEDAPGISLIADKYVSASYTDNIRIKKLGDWGLPAYDSGGENWLSIETMRHTVEAKEGYIPMTNLANNILVKFGGKIEKMTESYFNNIHTHNNYDNFIYPLLRAYFSNDPIASNIIKKGLDCINKHIAHIDTLTQKQLKISVNGSLSDLYKPLLPHSRLIDSSNNQDKASFLANHTNISKDEALLNYL